MTEAETSSVVEEFAAPEHEEMGEVHELAGQEEAPPVESDQDKNFRQLREANERLRKKDEERDQMMYAMQRQMLEHASQPKQPKKEPEPEVDELEGLDPSDWPTAAQAAAQSRRIARQEWEALEAEKHKKEAPNRVKAKHPDFDSVVTKESVKNLQAQEPDVWNALRSIGDEEAQAIACYKYIKAFSPKIVEETEASQRIQANADRPKSLSASKGASPLSQAGIFEKGLTPSLKAHLLAEMNECARRS